VPLFYFSHNSFYFSHVISVMQDKQLLTAFQPASTKGRAPARSHERTWPLAHSFSCLLCMYKYQKAIKIAHPFFILSHNSFYSSHVISTCFYKREQRPKQKQRRQEVLHQKKNSRVRNDLQRSFCCPSYLHPSVFERWPSSPARR
jgi:hypothetical protein